MTSKIDLIPEEEFKQLIQTSYSYNEVLKKIGMGHGRSSNDILKRRCKQLNISCEHFKRTGNGYTPKYELQEILVENSSYTNTNRLRIRLVESGLLKNECTICGNPGVWLNQPLSLQLDHINGIHNDNRLENLRILCPNCHTQTDTYGSKRGAKSE